MKRVFLVLFLTFQSLAGESPVESKKKAQKLEPQKYLPSSQVRLLLEDPRVPPRCKRLIQEREGILKMKRKLSALFIRNNSLLKITPKSKRGLSAKLRAHQIRTEEKMIKMEKKLQKKEEEILFVGCPGFISPDTHP